MIVTSSSGYDLVRFFYSAETRILYGAIWIAPSKLIKRETREYHIICIRNPKPDTDILSTRNKKQLQHRHQHLHLKHHDILLFKTDKKLALSKLCLWHRPHLHWTWQQTLLLVLNSKSIFAGGWKTSWI